MKHKDHHHHYKQHHSHSYHQHSNHYHQQHHHLHHYLYLNRQILSYIIIILVLIFRFDHVSQNLISINHQVHLIFLFLFHSLRNNNQGDLPK